MKSLELNGGLSLSAKPGFLEFGQHCGGHVQKNTTKLPCEESLSERFPAVSHPQGHPTPFIGMYG